MRLARVRALEGSDAGYYHCISRVVDRRFIFGDEEKEHFVALMRGYEAFCGVEIVTYCVMSNHFHILVKVPRRPDPDQLPSDAELIERVRRARCTEDSHTLKQRLERFRAAGLDEAAEEVRERFFSRMWDVSWFMKVLKQRFSQWYNRRAQRQGTLWEERFRSVLVEGTSRALAVVAAYIDLNPFRAGIVEDPADYRWSGYGEAMAGRKRARAGLRLAVEAAADGKAVEPEQVLSAYRRWLFEEGAEERRNEEGVLVRRGLDPEQVEAVLARGGRLSLGEALQCRVRYFCDGVALGSRAFVNGIFAAHRDRFGLRRSEGAHRWRGIDGATELYSLRDLRSATIALWRGR